MIREMLMKMLGYPFRLAMSWWGVQTRNDRLGKINQSENTETVQPVSGGFETHAEEDQQLLPGIPDEITFDCIIPKLPWQAFLTLSSMSRAWKRDIRSRQVYDMRVRSHSTETLVLINSFRSEDGKRASIGLYSVSDRVFYQLPGIPHIELGIPMLSQCISLDGKIYILGGSHDGTLDSVSDEVYVMDLARQGQWERCASMKHARRNFGCGVLDGRIYVCGGFSAFDGVGPESLGPAVWEPEVYDPEVDAWSPIKSMTSVRANDQVTAWGDELLLFKGQMFNPSYFDGTMNRADLDPDTDEGNYESTIYVLERYCFEAYSPVRNEWRQVNPWALGYGNMESVFVAEGKFHSMDKHGIYIYDFDRNSKAQRHSVCFDAIENRFPSFETEVTLVVRNRLRTFIQRQIILDACNTIVVNNELVSVVHLLSYIGRLAEPHLVQSTGFGSKEGSVTWERLECPFQMKFPPLMCTLQL